MNLPTKGVLKNIKTLQSSKYATLVPNLKEEKTQKFTTTVLTIVALIFFSIFAINPTLSTIANLQKQLQDDTFVEQQLQGKINNLSVLQQKYANVQLDLPAIYSAIPQKSEIPLLIAQLQGLASSTNLTLVNVQAFQVDLSNDLISGKNYSSYAFNFSATGTYSDMKNFISQVINMQRIITIENIAITKVNLQNNQSGLQLTIKGNAYFKP